MAGHGSLKTEIRTPLLFTSNEVDRTITLMVPTNVNDNNYQRAHRDVERIQWFSKGYGGVENKYKEALTFSFEQEEFNCIIRYLTKFEWKKISFECPLQDPLEEGTNA